MHTTNPECVAARDTLHTRHGLVATAAMNSMHGCMHGRTVGLALNFPQFFPGLTCITTSYVCVGTDALMVWV